MSATAELVAFVHGLDPASLAPELLDHVANVILDLAGVAMAGAGTPMARAAARFAYDQFGPGPATVIGAGRPLAMAGATWANGIAATALDFDEGHRLAMGHPAATVIPAALAVGEATGATGIELMAAVVAGYEVSVRTSAARVTAYKERQYSSGIWGVLGAAATAGKLLRLDPDGLQSALGNAASHGPFPPAGPAANSSMAKEVIGWAGMTGCAAALLARDGFRGPHEILDTSGRWDTGQVVQGLGDPARYGILSAYFKPHAVCRWAHAAIDATLCLVQRAGLTAGQVEHVRVETFYEGTRLLDYAPSTTIAAQFSIPFALALALCFGRVGPPEVSEANLHDPALLGLARKVDVVIDPELDALYPARTAARVIVQTSRGRLQAYVENPLGGRDNPLSRDQLAAKFHGLADPVAGEVRARRIREAVLALPQAHDVAALGELLRFEPAPRSDNA